MKNHNPDILPTVSAARRLSLQPATLRHWRMQGIGPRYLKFNGRCYYRPEDIDKFLEENTYTSTSDETVQTEAES